MRRSDAVFKSVARKGTFSLWTRAGYLDRLEKETFDLVVIGGGVTGAGIARDAAMRGLSIALIEKGDFGSGTSSKSSRMIHGGLRYLRSGDVRLVRESLHERETLLKLAPHLVHPFPHLFPIWEESQNTPLRMRLGLTAYDVLAGSRLIRRHTSLSRAAALEAEPLLRPDGLRAAFRYFDCLVNDARLTLATILSAAREGAVPVSYAEAKGLVKDGERVTGVRYQDRIGGRRGQVRGRVVVNAAGPWADGMRAMGGRGPMLRPTKGIHLTLPKSKLPCSNTVVIEAPDRRMMFVVPNGEYTYVGTTDTDYKGDPGDVRADASDVAYLLEAVYNNFEGVRLAPNDVVSTWAGVRPLVSEEGAPSSVSRDYEIETGPEGFVTIVGGKLTTYRAMAEDLVDHLVEREGGRHGWQTKPCRTAAKPLVGGGLGRLKPYLESAASALEEGWGLSPGLARRLVETYGTEHMRVLSYALREQSLLEPLAPSCDVLKAEALYAAEEEMALTLEDFMARRSVLMLFSPDRGLGVAEEAARLMGQVLKWSRGERRRQVEEYGKAVERMMAFAREVPVPAEGAA
jgi:glycerol-3-phosphate dehydrogenase